MPFEPIYKHLVVGLVPLQSQVPQQTQYPREALQRLYFDVTRDHSYQQFVFLPGEVGAHFANSPDDVLRVEPGLIQMQTPVDMTKERAREKAATVIKTAFNRLGIATFVQCGIKVVAHVTAPGAQPDAQAFMSERLMPGSERIEELGPGFFGGGVKFRRIDLQAGQEDNLLIEPFIGDNAFLFVDYDVARSAVREPLTNLGDLATWLDEAFAFVEHQAMSLLEV